MDGRNIWNGWVGGGDGQMEAMLVLGRDSQVTRAMKRKRGQEVEERYLANYPLRDCLHEARIEGGKCVRGREGGR